MRTDAGGLLTLGQVAKVKLVEQRRADRPRGHASAASRILINVRGRDMAGFVARGHARASTRR